MTAPRPTETHQASTARLHVALRVYEVERNKPQTTSALQRMANAGKDLAEAVRHYLGETGEL
jgi:hypothetical protein